MKRRLRPYQKDALHYAFQKRHPALFMEMRLGKTLVAIRRVCLNRDIKNVLIVAPNSAAESWRSELESERESPLIFLTGEKSKRRKTLFQTWDSGGFRNWYFLNKEGFIALPEIKDFSWDCLILDESTFIKNPKAKVTNFFIRNFRSVPYRWILTGTPNPESSLDFVCQMIFLEGRFLGYDNYWKFRARHCRPAVFGWDLKPQSYKQMKAEVHRNCFILSRKNAGIETEKIRQVRNFELPKKLRKIYNELEETFILEDLEGGEISSTIWAVSKYQMMRRLCGGWLEDRLVWNGKYLELLNLLTGELKGQKTVVWFNFNREIEQAFATLSKKLRCGVLRGSVDVQRRGKIVKDFQENRLDVLLVQQAVAQMGMDFSNSQTAIYFSEPTGNLARKQTEDRILNVSKGNGPLLYIYLVVSGTVEEDLRLSLKRKSFKSDMALSKSLENEIKKRRVWK